MAEKTKVKVNSFLIKVKKWIVFLPVLFILPYFLHRPTIAKVQYLSIIIVYYYVLFMGPIKFIEYFIKKLALKQKIVDALSWSCALIMFGWTFYNWIFVFMNKSDFDFASAVFLIPFIAFIACLKIIFSVVAFVIVFNYLSNKLKKKES